MSQVERQPTTPLDREPDSQLPFLAVADGTIPVEHELLGQSPSRPDHAPLALSELVADLEKENALLRHADSALRQSNDALTLLSETASELLSSDRPEAVIGTLFEKLAARLGLEAHFNYFVEEGQGKLRLNSYSGIPAEVAAEIEWLEYGQAVCGCVARDGAKIVAENIQCSTDVRTDLVRSFGITAYACHPLIARGKVVGTFSFGTSRKPQFEAHELALMQAVCDQVSMAMERRLLVAEARQQAADQSLLAEASRILASSLDYEETLADLAALLSQRLASWCIIDVAQANGNLRRVAVSVMEIFKDEIAAELADYRLLAPDEVHAIERVARAGSAEMFSTLSATGSAFTSIARQQRRLAELGADSAMVVPLTGRKSTLGTVTFVGTAGASPFRKTDLDLAKEVAYRAALAIENARLYREAREAIRQREEFLSVAAHELKTPLTSMRGFAQVVLRSFEKGRAIDDQRLLRALQVIDRQAARLSGLVAQLLDVSRIDAGQLSLECEAVELGELARAVVDATAMTNPAHRLTLRVHEQVWVHADALRLEQVLLNVVDNAIKFSPAGSEVEVVVWSPEIGTARLAVRDYGLGIPEEDRAHIFDRFYQAHAEQHRSGMGLGLYVSRQIINLHGGRIEAEAPAGGGTRVVISLPTAVADVKRRFESADRSTE